jgi:hypothetical protein
MAGERPDQRELWRFIMSVAAGLAATVLAAVAVVIWKSVEVTIIVLSLLWIVTVVLLAQSRRTARSVRAETAKLSGDLEAALGRVDDGTALEKWTAVTACTGLESFRPALGKSDLRPEEALNTLKKSLDFMGNGASKWSDQAPEMRKMLYRLEGVGEGGKARMLVLNPLGRFLRNNPAERQKILKSLMVLDRLRQDHSNLAVKVYDHRPTFRITLMDGDRAIVGHYRNYQEDSVKSPLLIFFLDESWSFFSPFKLLFDHEWKNGKAPDWDKLRSAFGPNGGM